MEAEDEKIEGFFNLSYFTEKLENCGKLQIRTF